MKKLHLSVIPLAFITSSVSMYSQSASTSTGLKLVACVEPKNCSHRLLSDDVVKILQQDGIAIAATLDDDGHNFRVTVGLLNNTKQPIDILPASLKLTMLSPKKKELRYVPPDKVVKLINGRAGWSNFFTALGAAGATQETTTQTSSSGNVSVYGPKGTASGTYSSDSTTTVTNPDYQAQQAAANQIAANNNATIATAQSVNSGALRGTTIDPGRIVQGTVYFERVRKPETTLLSIPINGTIYQFTFYW